MKELQSNSKSVKIREIRGGKRLRQMLRFSIVRSHRIEFFLATGNDSNLSCVVSSSTQKRIGTEPVPI